MNINQDLESQRIRRNLTKTQVKVVNSAREGAMINSNMPLSESYNSLLIADTVELPDKLYEKNTRKEKSLSHSGRCHRMHGTPPAWKRKREQSSMLFFSFIIKFCYIICYNIFIENYVVFIIIIDSMMEIK